MARILRHIAVEVGKINFPTLQVSNLYEFPDKGGEEKIIEFHNQSVGTPIGVVGFAHAGGVMARKLLRHACGDKRGVGVAEAVDALFGVADNQIVLSSAVVLFEQGAEVVPLHSRCVLKLVNQIMVDRSAEALINERGIVVAYYALQHRVGFSKLNHVV